MKLIFLLLTLLSLSLSANEKIKLLIVEGVTNHDWEHRLEIVRAILAREGSFEVSFSISPSTAGDPAWEDWRPEFANYDVVMSGYNNLGGKPQWPEEVKTDFENYLASGGGFFAYHEANNSFAEWDEYNKMIGLGWRGVNFGSAVIIEPDESLRILGPGDGQNTGHGARVNALVKKLGNHPIHAGLPQSWITADTEIYRYARGPVENVTVISYAKDPDTGLQFPMEWVTRYGEGRCYASSLGHVWANQAEPTGTRCAAFQTLMVRALKWLAKRDPGQEVPADFPGTTGPSLRAYEVGVSGLDEVEAVAPFNNGLLPEESRASANVQLREAFPLLSWDSPVDLKPWPQADDQVVVAELDGRLYRLQDDDETTERELLLDIRDRAWYYNWNTNDSSSKHGGLQTFVFHPRFGHGEGKDFIYLFYLFNENDHETAQPPYYDRLARFTWNTAENSFDAESELILINQYDTYKGHDGGGMAFGDDGFLYLAFGDEGSQNAAANAHTQTLNDRARSGIWRLDVDQQGGEISHPIRRQPRRAEPSHNSYTQGYYIPSDNPWIDESGATLEEFYAIGLRQPHRMSFDPESGLFWIGDVGSGRREEIDVVDAPGLNFQWNYREGLTEGYRPRPQPYLGTEREPVHDYGRGVGNCVIGGQVYRGNLLPGLRGKYLFGDNGTQKIYALDYDPITRTTLTVEEIGQGRGGSLFDGLSSFGHNAQGELFALQLGGGAIGGGSISRLLPQPEVVDRSIFPSTLSATGLFTDLATLTPTAGLIPYTVNMPLWTAGAGKQRWLMIPNDGHPDTAGEQITYSEEESWHLPVGSVLVKQFNHPDTDEKLETRVLIHGTDGAWGGVTYRWRADQSEADLLEEGSYETLTFGSESFPYYFPARNQCNLCHTESAGYVLGLKTRQLNRLFHYEKTGRVANQIETLSKLGLLSSNHSEISLRNSVTSAQRENTLSDAHYARSYLDANCSHCHHPGGTRALFDARLTTPLTAQGLMRGELLDALGLDPAVVISPGFLQQSVLFHRLNSLSDGLAMPPLAKGLVDEEAVARVANWILGLDADAYTHSAPNEGSLGNPIDQSDRVDTWHSNMVINESDTFTNDTLHDLEITLEGFLFHAAQVTDPLTPFIVRVNGDNDFTVLAVGTSRNGYSPGENNVSFAVGGASLILAPGETIAPGFLDARADGSGGSQPGAIAYSSGTDLDEIHYSGGPGNHQSGTVTVGQSPQFGDSIYTSFGRDYYFAITFSTDAESVDPDSDGDGLPDAWELAFTTDLQDLGTGRDRDQDGLADESERAFGTDPLDANSRVVVSECRPGEGETVWATFQSVPGRSYRVWVSVDLTDWQDQGVLKAADWPVTETAFEMPLETLPAEAPARLFLRLSPEATDGTQN
ncbi:ThuA domain-containing protein [Roseibacillus ishigakijimensis]|uniref:ThuA domain-containing protein n=1 Tax=Roseibacillus ishigakijimensis TaxID=454146 RepID=A0A934RQ08_9BACT|nr:ThuA domain-containing protein [Roseibacillus ishigakijimensis]MBK1832989.1 ThuA domain-containing protein [Roseibacillus ishigakijimensis]